MGFKGFDVNPYMPPLRVLSLFDGIGTALYTLDKMGFHIEVYYSSEINKKAIELLRHRYEDRMTMLGSVTELSPAKLLQLEGINLLIGGSPCNDLSLVNHRQTPMVSERSLIMSFLFLSVMMYIFGETNWIVCRSQRLIRCFVF
jgi:site-specific DNA-cytosine methylase